ncbi:pseudaminic acid cytidylyltransferase [Vibrio europaeus]|uniref:Pseudaminic acid cytidylyltransferase n=1 Tax=Vibrio europaeus TaxID=300876 RepID=A0A178JBV2_9VIBR|nr:pseudaminic acid cytidylyltransferase [Vibrio europaeus]MDC5703108.1 pseudaminic acid cytidylyltransferase [Vibrio europaeus]MDC5708660.1 pseudaminic acid cytidylyltransferase [Vibrio europaeus]MDC5713000.1 pseudaminic acid cytidylyltransferase [Vibrio europaeus]MDC5718013.1 pseudaminic acid cytidylyltransferase [Vibrio europaeus]MDC5725420.1 pseudaminic acid cytidylyltransferase [Vibrio europaeus]
MRVAIIPARGGSKRIPRKNIKLFHGKPMIAYSIQAALQSGCFDKVIVSTDDQEIAQVARQYGADIPFIRPASISDDYATTIDVINHAVKWCEAEGWAIDAVCCLYATAPFVQPKDLQKGLEKLESEPHCKYVFSATEFPFPIQRAIKLSSDGKVSMFSSEYENTRSQDLESAYHDAGQFYWGRKSAFLNRDSFFSSHSKVVLLPRARVQDIDTKDDWEFAELLYSLIEA